MKYHQRDLVEIDFPIPGEGFKVHPAIIVSNDELQLNEGFVYVVMVSSQDFAYSRQYAYPLTDEMLSCKLDKPSWVKCQLVAADVETSILRCLGTVKEDYFNEIVDKIIDQSSDLPPSPYGRAFLLGEMAEDVGCLRGKLFSNLKTKSATFL